MPTFADAVERVWTQMQPGWSSPRHGHEWKASLTRYVFPHVGRMPVGDLTSADMLKTLRPIWHRQPEPARRVRQRISAVMEWAIAMQYRSDNPCDRLGQALGRQQKLVRHMRALPHVRVASAIEAVQASKVTHMVKLAFEFLVLTAPPRYLNKARIFSQLGSTTCL